MVMDLLGITTNVQSLLVNRVLTYALLFVDFVVSRLKVLNILFLSISFLLLLSTVYFTNVELILLAKLDPEQLIACLIIIVVVFSQ